MCFSCVFNVSGELHQKVIYPISMCYLALHNYDWLSVCKRMVDYSDLGIQLLEPFRGLSGTESGSVY